MQLADISERHVVALHRVAWRSIRLIEVEEVIIDLRIIPVVALQEVGLLWLRVHRSWKWYFVFLKAFEHGITPIVCCGETLTQREQGITIDWIRQQIKIAFLNVTAEQAAKAVIAYEPIWAIGTGKVATTEQAQEVCSAIRQCICELYGTDTAEAIRIQYGGSVSADSAPELFAQPDIDGGLVGGASLKKDFGAIVNYK